jgi:hypothetical protein
VSALAEAHAGAFQQQAVYLRRWIRRASPGLEIQNIRKSIIRMLENRPGKEFHHYPELLGFFVGLIDAFDDPFSPDFINQVGIEIALGKFKNKIGDIAGFQLRRGLGDEMQAGHADVSQESPV